MSTCSGRPFPGIGKKNCGSGLLTVFWCFLGLLVSWSPGGRGGRCRHGRRTRPGRVGRRGCGGRCGRHDRQGALSLFGDLRRQNRISATWGLSAKTCHVLWYYPPMPRHN